MYVSCVILKFTRLLSPAVITAVVDCRTGVNHLFLSACKYSDRFFYDVAALIKGIVDNVVQFV